MLKRFLYWLALTKTERNVLAFLTATFLIGTGIRYVRDGRSPESLFDYRAQDSTFAARSSTQQENAVQDSSRSSDGRLDLNRASREELNALPGIGDVTAERIIQHRTTVGMFRSVDELTKVKGISRSKLLKLRPFITAGTQSQGVQSP
jgi:comEA protein